MVWNTGPRLCLKACAQYSPVLLSAVSVLLVSVKERHLEYEATLYSCIDFVFHARFNGALKKFYFPFQFTRLDLENRVHAVFLNFRITHFVRYSISVFTNKKLKKLKKELNYKSKWPRHCLWKYLFINIPQKNVKIAATCLKIKITFSVTSPK